MATKTRLFSDIDLSFAKHPVTGDVLAKYDENAIKNSVKNLILTKHYERKFRSDIGSSVTSLLFELPSPGLVAMLKTEITDTITNFEPRVEVLEVNIGFDNSNHYLYVGIIFKIVNTTTPITLQFTLDRKR
jgi:phage baseplate assembly protein W